ncbi:MAG: PhzF family phenazine biosynthesis protein [Actinomycetota bacterium]|nr:PhzF family phenazine biosynthesis protein [Actinomycetota bacterium]
MEFYQLDVFADAAYGGNQLAVFPDAPDLSDAQMQAIAREMNLSETTFVTGIEGTVYSLRIFTPAEELPFAGHPTVGTAWLLRHLGLLEGDDAVQRSKAGDTPVSLGSDEPAFERTGTVEAVAAPKSDAVAQALNLPAEAIGLSLAGVELRPGFADAGVLQLMVPIRTSDDLVAARPDATLVESLHHEGIYCFTEIAPGRVKARGFFAGLGISEDPATGSAAAGLGLYLGDRIGPMTFEISQGAEVGRPSRIKVDARSGSVTVAGRCELIFSGRLLALP